MLPGLANNLSLFGHALLCDQLFGRFGLFKLPANVIPMNINSARDQILKWMPDCNAHGVSGNCQLPTLEEELVWSSTLVERATKVETRMYKRTSKVEEAFIKRRIEEDKALRAAGKARPGGEE